MLKLLLKEVAIVVIDASLKLASALIRRKSSELAEDPLLEIQSDIHAAKPRED